MVAPKTQLNLIRAFARVVRQHAQLLKPEELEMAVEAIEKQAEIALAALDLSPANPPTATASQPHALSVREMQVLNLVSEGLPDKQIARLLGISPFTVNKHVSAILTKMQASSRTEASVRATLEGFLVERVSPGAVA